jgi:ankyrin repeat protein
MNLKRSIKKSKLKKKHHSRKVKKNLIKLGSGFPGCEQQYKMQFIREVAAGNFRMVSYLLAQCPPLINIENDFDIDERFQCATMMTSLYWAVSRNMTLLPFRNQYFPTTQPVKDVYYQIAELLIAKGANVNATTSQWFRGWAPIHWAAEYGNVDMINLLKNHGANVNLTYAQPKNSMTNLRTIAEMRIIPNKSRTIYYNQLLDSIASPQPTTQLPQYLPEYRGN